MSGVFVLVVVVVVVVVCSSLKILNLNLHSQIRKIPGARASTTVVCGPARDGAGGEATACFLMQLDRQTRLRVKYKV